MTDTSSLAITHATTDPYPVAAPPGSPVAANGTLSDSGAPDEEEPYTIKCICAFDEDDGSTVFCEGCETWQHIICYYPDKRVPDVHNCVDCEPRELDNRRATERQRQRRMRERSEDGDRRKRSSAKAVKKKKEGDINGFGHQRAESGAPLFLAFPLFLLTLAKGAHLPLSRRALPSRPPPHPLYSPEFLHLYDRDENYVDMDSNLFVKVSLVGDAASWVKDPEALARVTNGRRAEGIFNRSDAALDRSHWPTLTTDTITDSSLELGGLHPTWKILKTQDAVRKDDIVGEINGKVGIFDDYCLDPRNRWSELRHPEPFVFFSSHLPLYIDARGEGSVLRYSRRSCRPNVTMKIYITNDVEYHFCFVAKEDIAPGSEITIMWYLDAQLSESSNGLVKQESGDSAADAAAACISNTLANFGGCACNNPPDVAKQSNGKRKKTTKSKPGASPRESGRASTSRAGSESSKHHAEEDLAADSRSTSGSTRGRQTSRDISPAASVVASELSTRERRKIADAEKQFQQLEHDQRSTTSRKKKRASGTSAQSPSNVTTSTQTAQFPSQRGSGKLSQLDTTAGQSRSPISAMSPGHIPAGRQGSPRKPSGSNTPFARSPLRRPTYVDAITQTDPDEDESISASSRPRPSFVPLTMRLLKRFSMDRMRSEDTTRRQLSSAGSDSVAGVDLSSPLAGSPPSAHTNADIAMADADDAKSTPRPSTATDVEMEDSPIAADTSTEHKPGVPSKPPLSPPWPSTVAHNTPLPGSTTPTNRANLRVTMPPPSSFPLQAAQVVSPASTASIASPSTVDAASPHPIPSAVAPTPTPTRKKLSLGDYLSRKGSLTTPTSEKSQAQATTMSPAVKSPSTPLSAVPPPSADDSPEVKSDHVGPSDVAMTDAPSDSTQPPIPSIPS
ncbi:hypothetical protein N7470_001394 [Penicillium chermesinum]|nr:hypothetical protein N7470_001394 [Penicillium chermesinum]